MNIQPYRNNSINSLGRENDMNNKTFKEVQKENMKILFDKIRQEVPELGGFEPVYVVLQNPQTKDMCSMVVVPSYLSREERMLDLGMEIPETSNSITSTITQGTKQELLDFLGDERNIDKVDERFSYLKERINDRD